MGRCLRGVSICKSKSLAYCSVLGERLVTGEKVKKSCTNLNVQHDIKIQCFGSSGKYLASFFY
jgi:hypothetical protein